MNIRELIHVGLQQAEFVSQAYLKDLDAVEMLARPCPDGNHIAWQLGHLILSERRLAEAVSPGGLPELPPGFAARHSKEAARLDEPAAFLTKDDYLRLAGEIRSATRSIVTNLAEADFDKPVPPGLPPMLKRGGEVLLFIGTHWLMHAGQWAVIRRKLKRPPLF